MAQLYTIKGDFGLTVDHSYAGMVFRGKAGESLVFPNLCYQNSDGEMYKANASADETMPGTFICLESADDGEDCNFLVIGIARDDNWSWTVGTEIWTSETAGALTQIQPSGGSMVQPVAMPLSSTTILFIPSLGYVETT